MFILIIEKEILGAGKDNKCYMLAATVLPFAPYPELCIQRGSDEITLCNKIIWDAYIGYFRSSVACHICKKDETAEEVAADFIESKQWGVVATDETLEKVREEFVKQAVRDLQQILLRRTRPITVDPSIPGIAAAIQKMGLENR